MGIFLVLTPESILITVALMAIPLFISHRVVVAISAVSPLLPIMIWLFEKSWLLVIYAIVLLIFIGIRSINRRVIPAGKDTGYPSSDSHLSSKE